METRRRGTVMYVEDEDPLTHTTHEKTCRKTDERQGDAQERRRRKLNLSLCERSRGGLLVLVRVKTGCEFASLSWRFPLSLSLSLSFSYNQEWNRRGSKWMGKCEMCKEKEKPERCCFSSFFLFLVILISLPLPERIASEYFFLTNPCLFHRVMMMIPSSSTTADLLSPLILHNREESEGKRSENLIALSFLLGYGKSVEYGMFLPLLPPPRWIKMVERNMYQILHATEKRQVV